MQTLNATTPAMRVSPDAAARNGSGADRAQASPGKSLHGVRSAPSPSGTLSAGNTAVEPLSARKLVG